MRETGNTFSRRCAVCAMAAGVAFGAAAIARPAFGDNQEISNETAMVVPHLGAPGVVSNVALPQPLSPSDAVRARRIFADQAHGRVADAQYQTGQLDNTLLLGPILADRHLGPFQHSTVAELESWLANYGNQPDAAAIRNLLIQRLPKGSPTPPLVDSPHLAPSVVTNPVPQLNDGTPAGIKYLPWLDRNVASLIGNHDFAGALRLITDTPVARAYGALLRTDVARGLLATGQNAEAARIAEQAWNEPEPGNRVGEAAYIAGLAEWRQGKIGNARSLFSDAATAELSTQAQQSAAGWWAARAASRIGDLDAADRWLQRAASSGSTFYGLIARRFLGWPVGLIPGPQTLSQPDLDALAATQRGQRAFALLQVGQVWRAEQELRFLWPEVKDNAALRRAMLLVAQRAGLNGLAAEIADRIQRAEGIPNQDFHFQVPPLHPDGGFRLNPALLYGITRAESNFASGAVSPAGALGLMQLTPQTARAVAKTRSVSYRTLQDPGYNLKLGQLWLESLASDPHIDGNLIALLASYNCGVGSFIGWSKQIQTDDPLLFIESIPVNQTRQFVERALSYTWLYAARLGLPAPSLDALAAGSFPSFRSHADIATLLVSFH
jgi:soluble lytic murein transglycosylase